MKKNRAFNQVKKTKFDGRIKTSAKHQLRNVKTGVKDGVFIYKGPLTVSEFASKTNIAVANIIKHFFLNGLALTVNSVLTNEQLADACVNFGFDFKMETEVTHENIVANIQFEDSDDLLQPRPPIVTIMGHVDHGKTSLLDTIRKTNVTAKEFGGITQKIGAYQVKNHQNKTITFIDTPGHEAFTLMRARGAKVTDIVVLVVAADDGIKKQTEEAISHAKSANTPIIVFINKMDKPTANPDLVIQQLNKFDLVPEAWGGKTIFVMGSALTGQGINELLDNILLLGEVEGYQANYNAHSSGYAIEVQTSKGLGPIANVIVKRGTLKLGDIVVLGPAYGRVRTMHDENGNSLKQATPSKPVQISGFDIMPVAGEKFIVFDDEKDAKLIANKFKEQQKQKANNLTVNQTLKEQIKNKEIKILNLIFKADSDGSLQAIKQAVENINVAKISLSIIHAAVGQISESDIMLAKASGALLFSLNLGLSQTVKNIASLQGIKLEVHYHIPKLAEEIENILKGQLDPVYEEIEIGKAEVLQLWFHSKIGNIAGTIVKSGKIKRGNLCKLFRDKEIIFEGRIDSLKNEKTPVNLIETGKNCGIVINGCNDIKIGDIIVAYEKQIVKDGKL